MLDAGPLLFAVALAAMLAAIAWMDARTHRIPNGLNLALFAGGVLFQGWFGSGSALRQLVFGAAVFLFFLIVRQVHSHMTGVVGLGLGDVKMAGAGAVWFSPPLFPLFLFAASIGALGFVLMASAFGRSVTWRKRVPFGPFLGLGIAIAYATENFL